MPSQAALIPVSRSLRLACAAALCFASFTGPAVAAKVYRCGNVFQDQPCPEIKIAAATPSDRAAVIARDTPCATRDANGRSDSIVKPAAPRDGATDTRR